MSSEKKISISNSLAVSASGTKNGHHRSWWTVVFRGLLPLAVIVAGGFISVWMMETGPQAKPHPRTRNATLVAVRSVDYSSQQTLISGMGTVAAAASVELKPQVDLGRTEIKAPFNAVVLSRGVNLGTRASESSVLATLVDTDAYWVEVSVPVSQLRWIQIPQTRKDPGALVRIYDTAAWGENVFRQGRVIRLKSDLESQGRMARLLVQVDDPLSLEPGHGDQPRMMIGSYVRVEIQGNAVASAAAIEREFIRNGNSVWVMTPEGNLAIRPVEIAFRGAEQLLVTGGITSGEQLIVTDIATPVAGMPLRAVGKAVGQTATRASAIQGGRS